MALQGRKLGHRSSGLNLLIGPYAPAHARAPWRGKLISAGVYAAILLVLAGASTWLDISQKSREIEELRAVNRAAFSQVLPDVTSIVDEAAQLRDKVNQRDERAKSLGALIDPETSPLWVLQEISRRLPDDVKVEMRDFQTEPERIRIEGETTSFDAIDKIQERIEEVPRFASVSVSDAKAGVDQQKVLFKLTIQLGESGAEGGER